MRYLIAFIIFSCSSFAFCQETKKVTLKDKKNDSKEVFYVLVSNDTVKHGDYKLYYKNKLEVETSYINGLLEGLWTEYNTYTGKKQEVGYYSKGLRENEWKIFQKNGIDIRINGNYIHDKKEGKWIGYHENGKNLQMEETYINGLKEGWCFQYDSRGKIIEKANFSRGLHFGLWEFYNNDDLVKYNFTDMLPCHFSNTEINKDQISALTIRNKDTIELKLDTPILNTWKIAEYSNFLAKNIKYPQIAIEEGIQGKVHIQYTVDENSIAKDFKVIKGVPGCSECDKEALRVVKLMPQNWKAAVLEGKPISGSSIITIVYRLE